MLNQQFFYYFIKNHIEISKLVGFEKLRATPKDKSPSQGDLNDDGSQTLKRGLVAALFFCLIATALIGDSRILPEDAAKFFGVMCWTVFLSKISIAPTLGNPRL
ncbi:hypothetical protein [Ruegeria atlantica]|uniref:hypothetical protein n=1 Tax=Ruegeria atlantica TaxID=81569 RepID=UPI00147FE76A|nr:hypothetical protein [Ruegeria atlantica]